jgi:DNA processing protein
MALVARAREAWARDATLYVRGSLPSRRGVCVVGSRETTKGANAFATEVAKALVAGGWAVWSGGASGIDTSVHLGALEAGGPTVAVLGGGHANPFPKCNGPLFDQIAEKGATISLEPDEVKASRHFFLRRNTLLTALTDATVVIQANARPSGAMHAASAARRMGKPVLCPPEAPWVKEGAGNLVLLEEGAIVFHSIDELVARLGALRGPWCAPEAPSRYARARAAPALRIDLSDDDRTVLDLLGDAPEHVDALCERSDLPYLRLTASLVALVLAGAAVEPAPGFFCRARGESAALAPAGEV